MLGGMLLPATGKILPHDVLVATWIMIAEPTPIAQMMPARRPNVMLSRTTLAKSAPGAIAASTNTPNRARNSGERKVTGALTFLGRPRERGDP